ncbi:MAG: O-antigen ligase family protein [Chthoniobacterales bacterium]
MPPPLALLLTLAFIFFLFWRETRENSKVSSALWIPLIWLVLTASKFPSQWLSAGAGQSPEDGSPLDAAVFFGLIVCGAYVLKQRRVSFRDFSRYNVWITVFLAYCLVSILWSDFPFVAFKRWIKVVALPIMALVVLTDPDPKEALRRLLKRTGYVLLPLSLLFIKYFPQYGRGFDAWSGLAFNCGVHNSKNELGCASMILGSFFCWNTLQSLKIRDRRRGVELLVNVGFFGLACWLLKLSSSATSLVGLVITVSTILVLGLPFVSRRHVTTYVVVGILIFAVAEPMFGIYKGTLGALGRDASLTDRTEVWHDALQLQPDPILGAGFESFWLGPRLEKLWEKWWWRPNQAHDGYIETYLNLGYVGIIILAGMIIGTFRKASRAVVTDFEFGRFRLGILLAIVVYNFTEATFKGVHMVWMIFYLIALDYPLVRSIQARAVRKAVSVPTQFPRPEAVSRL